MIRLQLSAYAVAGYVSSRPEQGLEGLKWLGGYDKLGKMLDKFRPDEAVCAIGAED